MVRRRLRYEGKSIRTNQVLSSRVKTSQVKSPSVKMADTRVFSERAVYVTVPKCYMYLKSSQGNTLDLT